MFILYIIYIFYGLAFFTLGVAVLTKDTKLSSLDIAPILWLLGLFGVVHGLHEWIELYMQMNKADPEFNFMSWKIVRLLIVESSYVIMLVFALELMLVVSNRARLFASRKNAKLWGAFIILILTAAVFLISVEYRHDKLIRNLIGFTSSIFAGIGLVLYSKSVMSVSKSGAANFRYAGFSLVAYAFLTGVIPTGTIIPLIGINVVLLRGLSALSLMFFMLRAMKTFDEEQYRLIEKRLQLLAQSEKLTSIGKLAAGIAHEINNPLSNALLSTEILKGKVEGNEKALARLESIEKNIERAGRIARELLLYSREKGVEFTEISTESLLESVKTLLSNQPFYKNIRFKCERPLYFQGIFWKVEEVLINLIMNAAEACPENPEISVECSEEDGFAVIKVRDNGHGIPENIKTKVFDPFFTTKEVGKGTGMGLYVTYNIMRLHGGSIEILSEEGKGTEVSVRFPEEACDGGKNTDN